MGQAKHNNGDPSAAVWLLPLVEGALASNVEIGRYMPGWHSWQCWPCFPAPHAVQLELLVPPLVVRPMSHSKQLDAGILRVVLAVVIVALLWLLVSVDCLESSSCGISGSSGR